MKHTKTPWRVGNAGITVFGPPNGNPSPETVVTVKNKANAEFIVKACNSHEELLGALLQIKACHIGPDAICSGCEKQLEQAIANAEGGKK